MTYSLPPLPADHGDLDVWAPKVLAAFASIEAKIQAMDVEIAAKAEIIESLTDPGGADGTWWAVPS